MRSGEEPFASLAECKSHYTRLVTYGAVLDWFPVRGGMSWEICWFLHLHRILVFAKRPIIGIIIEFVGFIGLFGLVLRDHRLRCFFLTSWVHSSFFPVILQALRQTPFIGPILSLPYIRGVSAPETWLPAISVIAYHIFTGCRQASWSPTKCCLMFAEKKEKD